MPRTKEQVKIAKAERERIFREFSERTQRKFVRCRPESFPWVLGGPLTFDGMPGYILYPPNPLYSDQTRWGKWSVRCLGTNSLFLMRAGLSEDKAVSTFENVRDWATMKRLVNLGFKIAE